MNGGLLLIPLTDPKSASFKCLPRLSTSMFSGYNTTEKRQRAVKDGRRTTRDTSKRLLAHLNVSMENALRVHVTQSSADLSHERLYCGFIKVLAAICFGGINHT